jgi:hypothetical protein
MLNRIWLKMEKVEQGRFFPVVFGCFRVFRPGLWEWCRFWAVSWEGWGEMEKTVDIPGQAG